jgi:hypothetical protein
VDSNAQHGDLIEVTNPARVDVGQRMQVATTGDIAVTALDNRVRVKIDHGDYKIVRRCGRPAVDDAPKPKVGRPSNAEVAARDLELAAAAVRHHEKQDLARAAAVDETKKPVKMPYGVMTPLSAAERAKLDQQSVTDKDVAQLEQVLYDVPVTRKTAPAEHGTADKPAPGERETAAEKATREIENATGIQKPRPEDYCEYQDRLAAEAAGYVLGTAKDVITLTQEHFDTMTRQTEPRGFILADAQWTPEQIAEFTRKPEGIVTLKHAHYFKRCPYDSVDVYRVLSLFGVTDPCLQHAVKKLLVAGGRGVKDIGKDVQEAIDTLERFKDMRNEEAA